MPQLYKLVIQATGEVRDADGNLVSTVPVETEMVVTEDDVKSLIEGEQ